ncbi:copper resistance CopC family protein [Streptomyces sp. NPDC002490]|uniref:copper resistance CopC family protein n=1 Tax=Streptomyces sp. NPDC002490 TaxID=3154416 RepID=UPI003330DB24
MIIDTPPPGRVRGCRPPYLLRCLAASTALVALTVNAPPAAAQPVLDSGAPGGGEVLGTPPDRVTLTFTTPLSREYAQLAVSTRQGGTLATSTPHVHGRRVTASLVGEAPAGRYRVGYRVLTADGRPVSGSYAFTVRAARPGPGATTPGGPATRAVRASVRVEARSGGPGPAHHVSLAAVGAGLVAGAAMVARAVRRRRPRPSGPPLR